MTEEQRDSIKTAGFGTEHNPEEIPKNNVITASDEDVMEVSRQILDQNREAYNVLSK